MSDKNSNNPADGSQAEPATDAQAIIWVSDAMRDTELLKAFNSDHFLKDKKSALNVMKRVYSGEPLPAECFPKEMYVQSRFDTVKNLPDFFKAGGLWVISSRFSDILSQHELGNTGLQPVTLFNHDRTEQFPGNYYCIGFGETKNTVIIEKSEDGLKEMRYNKNRWRLRPAPKDNLVTVSRDALIGPDLWMEPNIDEAFFVSGRLVKALEAAGLAKHLDLYQCAVIS